MKQEIAGGNIDIIQVLAKDFVKHATDFNQVK
jgi:hypothetical protein